MAAVAQSPQVTPRDEVPGVKKGLRPKEKSRENEFPENSVPARGLDVGKGRNELLLGPARETTRAGGRLRRGKDLRELSLPTVR